MTSASAPKPAGVATAQPPRRPRGFITSYGVGRVCANADCRTTLSRYNDSTLCYPHAIELEARLHRRPS